jgi:hypothetical protein
MSCNARKASAIGPAPVTVHDDGNMGRNACRINRIRQRAIHVRVWQEVQETFHERNPYGTPLWDVSA